MLKNYAWVDKIIVANYRFLRLNGDPVEPASDNTEEIIKEVNLPNVELLKGEEVLTQAEVFDRARNRLLDYDLIFISDADEILLPKDQQRIIKEIKPDTIQVVCNVIDYATEDLRCIYPIRTHKPIVAVRPSIQFSGTRCGDGQGEFFNDVYMHHFGYVDINDWKINNLWYQNDTYSWIISQPKIDFQPPEELVELLKEK